MKLKQQDMVALLLEFFKHKSPHKCWDNMQYEPVFGSFDPGNF